MVQAAAGEPAGLGGRQDPRHPADRGQLLRIPGQDHPAGREEGEHGRRRARDQAGLVDDDRGEGGKALLDHLAVFGIPEHRRGAERGRHDDIDVPRHEGVTGDVPDPLEDLVDLDQQGRPTFGQLLRRPRLLQPGDFTEPIALGAADQVVEALVVEALEVDALADPEDAAWGACGGRQRTARLADLDRGPVHGLVRRRDDQDALGRVVEAGRDLPPDAVSLARAGRLPEDAPGVVPHRPERRQAPADRGVEPRVNPPSRRAEAGRQEGPDVRETSRVVDLVEQAEELERADIKGPGRRLLVGVRDRDEDSPARLVHLDDLATPAHLRFARLLNRHVIRRIARGRPRTVGDRPFPGPVEFHGPTDLQRVDRPFLSPGDLLPSEASQSLLADGSPILVLDRGRGVFQGKSRGYGEVKLDSERRRDLAVEVR